MTNQALNLPGFTDALDVSQVQRITDAPKVYAAGFRVAWVKASEGLSYCDPKAPAHLAALEDAGLLVTIYGFARVQVGKPREQAEKALSCGGDVYRTRQMLDLESAPGWMDSVELCDYAEAYFERLDEEGASKATLYTYTSFLLERLLPELAKRPRLLSRDYHAAQYRSLSQAWAPQSVADLPRVNTGPFREWKALQYSGNAGFPIDGIEGDVDRNIIRGTPAEVRAWMGYPAGEPESGGIVRPAVPLGRPAM